VYFTERLGGRDWLPTDIKRERERERRKVGWIIRKKKRKEQREMRETFVSKIIALLECYQATPARPSFRVIKNEDIIKVKIVFVKFKFSDFFLQNSPFSYWIDISK
jgi:hypothetical protein